LTKRGIGRTGQHPLASERGNSPTRSAAMYIIVNMKNPLRVLLTAVLLVGLALSSISCVNAVDAGSVHTARIGVLLPLTGDRPLDWERILDWEASKVNEDLRDTSFRIQLVYKDTFGVDVADLAKELIADRSLDIALGPMTSREAMRIAPQFARAKKLLISPCATSDDLFRAFAGQRCFARTCQSDVAQTSTILSILKSRGTKRLSLIYENTTYGRTFLTWMGFFVREMGIDLVSTASFAPGQADMLPVVQHAVTGGPDQVVLAAFPTDAANIVGVMDDLKVKAGVFSTDAAMQPSLVKMLGEKAEGFEGVTPSADPASGFAAQYKKAFGRAPEAWSAETYDALAMAACVAARHRFAGGKSTIYDAFTDVATGKGKTGGCSLAGIAQEIKVILKGSLPLISGATGPLVYDRQYGVDTLDSYYAQWRIAGGELKLVRDIQSSETMPPGIIAPGAPEASALPSPQFMNYQRGMPVGVPAYTLRNDLWAVIIATSSGLDDYRHQADALSMYWLLRTNGVADDRIILMMADDVKDDAGNTDRGRIKNQVGGIDLRAGADIDYSGEAVTSRNFENVMLGIASTGGRPVLKTSVESDALVYIAGDGEDGDIYFSNSPPMTARETGRLVQRMDELGRFRQMLLLAQLPEAADACRFITSRNAVALAASSHEEAAVPANYDSDVHVWLADRFTFEFVRAVSRSSKNLSIADVYRRVYLESGGSHVSLVNYRNFDVEGTKISDFIRP
jgi:ABC-type branched-subunit amino acid transport system substrate-binding protein